MEKDALLRLVAQARRDATRARELLAKLISTQDSDLAEMERLLDELDQG
jgi:hypothetical protein